MKFCPKCGAQNRDSSKYCTICGSPLGVTDNSSLQSSNRRKRRAKWPFFLAGLLVVAVVIAAVVVYQLEKNSTSEEAAAVSVPSDDDDSYFNEVDAATILNNDDSLHADSGIISDEVDMYYKKTKKAAILYEDETLYVDSQLLLVAVEGTEIISIENFVKEYRGDIVGYISITDDYQVEFPDGKSLEELNQLIEEFSKNELIESVTLHKVFSLDTSEAVYENDVWNGADWDEWHAEGDNWAVEAIRMLPTWELAQSFPEINVGIIDTMFDLTNEDLDEAFVEVWENPDKITNAHGSHVAGIIGAEMGNYFGIAGICTNSNLYGFSLCGAGVNDNKYIVMMSYKYAIALMLENNVKVINISMGSDEMSFAAQMGVESAYSDLQEWKSIMETFLLKCLNRGYDFVIALAAGNISGYSWVACTSSEEHPYGYSKAEDLGLNFEEGFQIEADAEYAFLAGIQDEQIKSRIIVVGAVKQDSSKGVTIYDQSYSVAHFSCTGDRVDILAPGVHILSTVTGNITDFMDGTSQATPMVAGVAALVWSVNENLTGDMVKKIVCSSATTPVSNSDVGMANAYIAVSVALELEISGDSTDVEIGFVIGQVSESALNDDNMHNPIEDATVSLYLIQGDRETLVDSITTDAYGNFDFIIELGSYKLTIEYKGYAAVERYIEASDGDVLYFDDIYLVLDSVYGDEGTNPEDMYNDVLTQYRNAIQNDYYRDYFDGLTDDDSIIGKDLNRELLSASRYYDPSEYSVYYAFYDVDQNGIPELFISADRSISENKNEIGKYDIFTWRDGEIYHLLDDHVFGYRDNFTIHNDGIIASFGSGGANLHGWDFYKISSDGHTPTLIESVTEDGSIYYKGINEYEQITKDEFENIIKKNTNYEPYELKDDVELEWQKITIPSQTNTNDETIIYYDGMYASFSGVIRRYEWEHPNGSQQIAYLLELDEPATFEVYSTSEETTITAIDQNDVQIWDGNPEQYINQHVSVSARIVGDAGTIYYIRPVVFDYVSITSLDY